jgi:penicillin amidase
VAFELFRRGFSPALYGLTLGAEDWAAFANVGRIKSLMLADIEQAETKELTQALREALRVAAANIDEFADWGEMHRLGLSHPLGFLPIVGSRYRFTDLPIEGSTDTLMKTAHGLTRKRHFARYGSVARHVSDMSHIDLNYFVLLGGQDGWINSSTFLDQLPIWLEGRYIQMPLRLEAVRARSRHTTVVLP